MPSWAPLPVQYIDYTLWQRAQFGDLDDPGSVIGAQLAYWEQALAGMAERVVLPTDRPYPVVADYRGAAVAVEWPVEVQELIAGLARQYNATAFMVVQAALAVLLGKLGGTSDVAVGFPIAGVRIRFWMIWWGSSSTRWCCGWIWVGIPRWPRCWRGSGAVVWRPSSIRMCPSRCSSSGSTPPAR